MKIGRIIVVVFLIVFIGYVLYLGIGMSYTYPSIKEYYYDVNKVSFEEKLAVRIDSANGWSLQRKDSIKGKDGVSYWTSLFYEANGQDLEYTIKYCLDLKTSSGSGTCVRLEIVGAFDYANKTGGYKLSDSDAEKLLYELEHTILNELAPACSSNP